MTMLDAFKDWFSDWVDAGLYYDEPPPRLATLGMVVVALAGMVALARNEGGFGHAGFTAVTLGPLLVVPAVLLTKWCKEGAPWIAVLVGTDLVVSIAAGALLAGVMFTDAATASRWIEAFVLLSVLPGMLLHARAWAVLFWYAGMNREPEDDDERVREALARPANGVDFVVFVRKSHPQRVEVDVRDANGSRPAWTLPPLLGKHVHVGWRYLVTGAVLSEELEPGGDYRTQRASLCLTAAASTLYVGREGGRGYYGEELAAGTTMLLLQHVGIGVAAAFLAPWLPHWR